MNFSRLNVEGALQYFGFYLTAAFIGGSILGNLLSLDNLYIFSLIFCLIILLRKNTFINKNILFYVLVLGLSMISTYIYSRGDLSILSIGNILLRYLLIYSIVYINPKKVLERFLRFAYFVACFSLICYVFSSIVGHDFLYNVGIKLGGLISSLIFYNSVPIHFGRNMGMFGEPGQYQIFLSVALFFSAYFFDFVNTKEKIRYSLVFIFTIITVQSTSGYITLIGFLLVSLMLSNLKMTTRMIILSAVVIFGFYVFFILDKNSSLYYNLVGKILTDSDKINLAGGSGSARINSISGSIALLQQNYSFIWGIGYSGAERLGLDGTASLLGTLITFGVVSWGLIYGAMLKVITTSYKYTYQKILAIYIILVAGLTQPNILNPFLIFLAFVVFLISNMSTKISKIESKGNPRHLYFRSNLL